MGDERDYESDRLSTSSTQPRGSTSIADSGQGIAFSFDDGPHSAYLIAITAGVGLPGLNQG